MSDIKSISNGLIILNQTGLLTKDLPLKQRPTLSDGMINVTSPHQERNYTHRHFFLLLGVVLSGMDGEVSTLVWQQKGCGLFPRLDEDGVSVEFECPPCVLSGPSSFHHQKTWMFRRSETISEFKSTRSSPVIEKVPHIAVLCVLLCNYISPE